MKLLFFGTPEEAVPFLRVCSQVHEVAAVITRPDRPAGRGMSLQSPPVKSLARELGIPVMQPETPVQILEDLRRLKADLAVVVAYGKLLPQEVLDAVSLGFLNVHFSLLPKFRGAAPIEWAIIQGESRTGVTIFWLDRGMDTGSVQAMREISIGPDDDAVTLKRKLIDLGVALLQETLRRLVGKDIVRAVQAGEPSFAPKLTKESAWIDFDGSAWDFHNKVRGLAAKPYATLRLASPGKMNIGVLKTEEEPCPPSGGPSAALPGTALRVERDRGILVQCNVGQIWIKRVQPEGKRPMPAADFANGLRLKPGFRFVCLPAHE